MKSILLPLLAATAFIILVGFLTRGSFNGNLLPAQKEAPLKEITVGSTKVTVKIADTEDKRKQGLSGILELGENEGMLFIFDTKNIYPSFWMRGMLIPIDIIWIKDGTVSKIDKNLPAPKEDTPDSELKLYYPDKPIDYVLEVNAGFSDKNDVGPGDSVDLSSI